MRIITMVWPKYESGRNGLIWIWMHQTDKMRISSKISIQYIWNFCGLRPWITILDDWNFILEYISEKFQFEYTFKIEIQKKLFVLKFIEFVITTFVTMQNPNTNKYIQTGLKRIYFNPFQFGWHFNFEGFHVISCRSLLLTDL